MALCTTKPAGLTRWAEPSTTSPFKLILTKLLAVTSV